MSHALIPSTSGPARPSAPPQAESPKSGDNPLLMVHKFLRGRYWLAILLACLFGPCGAVAGYFAVQLEYTSNSTIRIQPYLPKILFESEQSNIMPMFDSFFQTQVSLISSPRVVNMALQSEVWKGAGGQNTPESLTEFTKSLSVIQPSSSQLMVVGFTNKDPALARAGAMTVVDAYMTIYGGVDVDNNSNRFTVLEDREQQLMAEIASIRNKILDIAKEYGLDDLSSAHKLKLAELQTLQSELSTAKMQLANVQARSGIDSSMDVRDYSKLSIEEIGLMDSRMQSLLDERKRLQRDVDAFESKFRRPNERMEYKQAVEYLDVQNSEIETYAQYFRENAVRGAATAAASPNGSALVQPMLTTEQLKVKVDALQTLHDEAQAEALDLGRKNLEINDQRANLERVQEGLNETKSRIEQLNLESSASGRITVLNQAELPSSASNSKRRIQMVILGGLAGGGLGIGIVLLLGFFNPRIRDIEDAQDIRPRLLGALPLLPVSLTTPAEAFVASQCVHQIRTILHTHMPPHETLSLTITAPNSGAGKTSFALSLGLSFASSGTRTLIIDGDMVGTGLTHRTGAAGRCKLGHVLRKYEVITEEESRRALDLARRSGRPIGHSLLELGYISEMDLEDGLSIQEDSGLGLADALDGEPFENCLADIGVPNLTILPASRKTSTPLNALSPTTVRSLLARLRDSFDVILIDAGPVPGTTDATIMATCADGVIMVASRGDQGSDAERALKHLHDLNVFVVGLVFNRAKIEDIERSRYSSSVSVSKNESAPKEYNDEFESAELSELLESVSRFGPLPQAVWLSTMHPDVLRESGVPA